jgi:ABC-2 type transport system permease protein
MKLSEFKEAIRERLVILKASLIFTAQRELAYAGNNWASILSTTFYTFSILIFVKVIYANVQTVAGYTYNEALLFFFVSQMTYYTNWTLTMRNLNEMIPDINKGNLDLVLIKPVPTLFYLMTRSISAVYTLLDSIPPMIAITLSINWQALNLIPSTLITGILVWILGLISLHSLQFLAALPVFWLGESQNVLDLVSSTAGTGGTMIPLEGYNQNLQKLLGTIVPILIASAFTTSIILGKSEPFRLFFWALIVSAVSLIIRNIAWKSALKQYTSASS